jgi:hypothetical protein
VKEILIGPIVPKLMKGDSLFLPDTPYKIFVLYGRIELP